MTSKGEGGDFLINSSPPTYSKGWEKSLNQDFPLKVKDEFGIP